MENLDTFENFLNEGKITIDGMKFTVSCFDALNRGTAIQFIPDWKTLDISKNEQVDAILAMMHKKVPFLADIIWYESGSSAAGLIFRINNFDLTAKIQKALK